MYSNAKHDSSVIAITTYNWAAVIQLLIESRCWDSVCAV